MPSIRRISSGLPLLSRLSNFERFDAESRFTCPAAFFFRAGVASLSQGLLFDGPFLPAVLVVFFFVLDDELLLDDLLLDLLDDLLLALLDDLLDVVFLGLDFLELLEDFSLLLELFDFSLEVDLLAGVFLAAFGFGFGLDFDCAKAGDERPIASRMARRVFTI